MSSMPYLLPCPSWDAWLAKSGEAPPDFDSMPSVPGLPAPLAFGGRQTKTAADWPEARRAILEVFKRWSIGTYPPAPGNVAAEVLHEDRTSTGAVVREVRLTFGPGRRAKLHLEFALPLGDGPFPIFMTQRTHVGWARVALSRGYATVAYDGCDQADDARAFAEVWPEHDWSLICRRAWAAGRVIDWLETLPAVDARQVCITGHSRNGKLALIAGAIDERFAVIVSSSSGVGGATPFRLANESHFCEGIELLTRAFPEWFHPRLRFFAGREDRLPVDANLLLALSAPRAVLVSTALNDSCESLRGNEAAVRSAGRVWELFGTGARERLRIMARPGEHGTLPGDIERYLDWCDLRFARATGAVVEGLRASFAERWFFPYTFAGWRESGGAEGCDPAGWPEPPGPGPVDQGDFERRINLVLGEPPANAPRTDDGSYGVERPYLHAMLYRSRCGKGDDLECARVNFGACVPATVYALSGAMNKAVEGGGKLPVAIWLGPESVAAGHAGGYIEAIGHQPAPLARAGFAAFAYDQIGTGSRLTEATRFYERHPRWSLLGKMVGDARAALTRVRSLPYVDPERVFFVGFGIGGAVALLAAVLEEKTAGAAAVCGFTPLRTDVPDRPTGGLARYALWDAAGLVPRLGLVANDPAAMLRIPFDFDEVLAAIAPRHLVCVAPKLDREADAGDVARCFDFVERAYSAAGAAERFRHWEPPDHRRLSPDTLRWLCDELRRAAGM